MAVDEKKDEIAEKALEEAIIIKPLDGGYGWIVVLASFMANVIVDGIIFTAGPTLLPLWQRDFNSTDTAVSLTMSVLSGSYLLIGPVCAALANLYGCRAVVIGGSILSFFGFICSTIAPKIYFLYFSFGLVGGVGLGLVYLPAIVVIAQYFEKKRALATGIAVCGSGIGTTFFATVNPYVLHLVGGSWRLFVVYLAILPLTGIICAFSFRPVEASSKQIEKVTKIAEVVNERRRSHSTSPNGAFGSKAHFDTQRPFLSTLELNSEKMEKYQAKNTSQHDLASAIARESVRALNRPLSKVDVFYPGSTDQMRHRSNTIGDRPMTRDSTPVQATRDSTVCLSTVGLATVGGELENTTTPSKGWKKELGDTLKSLLDTSLLYSPSFLILALSGFMTMICFFVPFNYLSVQMDKLEGLTDSENAMPISVIGIMNIVARIGCGWIADRPKSDVLQISSICIMLAGAATFMIPLFTQFWMYIVFCIPFASGVACFAALRSIITAELFGMEKLSNAFGILLMCMGIGALSGTPIAAMIKDVTGNFDMSFYIMGFLMVVSGLICVPLRKIRNWEIQKSGTTTADASNQSELEPLK